jgi:hypothetical protein
VALNDHPFTTFQNFSGSVTDPAKNWEIWDRPIINVMESIRDLRELIKTGPNGLNALLELLLWLAAEHHVPVGLMEGKIQRLLDAMATL